MSVDFEQIYSARIKKVSEYLEKNNIAIAVFHDSEDFRDPNLRYLSGHPSDAVLFVTKSGKAILSPWDENLARQKAHCSEMIPFTEFKRDYVECVKSIAEKI
ncbi:MAG: aminopeptidase P family N-terminal domain-containing protein, partial [Treponema sp.]|nr:aminopeptidase P family N-terminal domain-containing protein [Treponema sp.]